MSHKICTSPYCTVCHVDRNYLAGFVLGLSVAYLLAAAWLSSAGLALLGFLGMLCGISLIKEEK